MAAMERSSSLRSTGYNPYEGDVVHTAIIQQTMQVMAKDQYLPGMQVEDREKKSMRYSQMADEGASMEQKCARVVKWRARADVASEGGRGERGGYERAGVDMSERGSNERGEEHERRTVGGRKEGREKQEGGRREEERSTTRRAADAASSACNAHGPARRREYPRGTRHHRIERTATIKLFRQPLGYTARCGSNDAVVLYFVEVASSKDGGTTTDRESLRHIRAFRLVIFTILVQILRQSQIQLCDYAQI
ncbi:hypothetical protein DENSPDRAFT_855002 [Dentipellis sp. KUC8613]|nr:hypothetical protein DENSPDRAFT_855002 [Dentipellis sp. KUC8613]